MRTSEAEQAFHELWGEVADLDRATSLLHWDRQVCMPAGGEARRGRLIATLQAARQRALRRPELRDTVDRCAAEAEPGSVLDAEAREARRQIDRAVRIPENLVVRLEDAAGFALTAWRRARDEGDARLFLPALERLVELETEEAAAIDDGADAYDVLLGRHEPGWSSELLEELFAELSEPLARLIAEARQGVAEDGGLLLSEPCPAELQMEFGRQVMSRLGFDFTRGRVDTAAHSFCTVGSASDVRLTARAHEDDLRSACVSLLHEAGHALYEQGLPEEWERRPLGTAPSVALHEAQSYIWDTLVGRSRPFWRWALPRLHARFPSTRAWSVGSVWRSLHQVVDSPLRTDADPLSYDLHVLIRFRLERRLFAGDLEVGELPAAWRASYRELLGIVPAGDRDGLLQDVHWARGLFGLFPSYTLGRLIGAQLFSRIESEVPELDRFIERGDFAPLLGWLREHVYRLGALQPTRELLAAATGRSLSTRDLLARAETIRDGLLQPVDEACREAR